MKILITAQAQIPPRIGMGTRLWELAKNLQEMGHTIHVIASKRNGDEKEFEIIDGISVYRVAELRKPTRWLASLMIPAMFFKTFQICKKEKIDLMYAHLEIAGLTSIAVKKLTGIPVVYDYAGLILEEYILNGLCKPNSFRANMLEKIIHYNLTHSDKIITASPHQKKLMSTTYPAEKIELVSNGANLNLFKLDVQPMQLNKPCMIHLGLLEGWAGGDVLIESAKKVVEKRKDVHFYFLGDGPKLKELKELTKKYGVEENVHFLGRVPYTTVPQYIAAADIGILMFRKAVSMDVATPIKLFEYASMKKPVVAPPAEEVKNIIEEKKLGILGGYQAEEYSHAILELLNNPKLMQSLGENGRRAVEEQYNWKTQSQKLEKIFEGVAKKY